MLGKIKSIIDNTVIVDLELELEKIGNLINRYVIIKSEDENIVGEIIDIKEKDAYINIVGNIIDGKFVFGEFLSRDLLILLISILFVLRFFLVSM